MSENYDQLEALLRGLRPAAPDPEMQERVGADLKLDEAWLPRQVRRAPRWLVATGWAGLGAAAAVMALTILTGEEPRGGGGEERRGGGGGGDLGEEGAGVAGEGVVGGAAGVD